MTLIASSFPELAYLVMREHPDVKSFRLKQLVELAQVMAAAGTLRVNIDSQYPMWSPGWVENLNGCLKRESGDDNAVNEDRFCIFASIDRACTEPWNLSSMPLPEETYAGYRRRLRGGHTAKRSAGAKREAEAFRATPVTKVIMKAEPLYVVTPVEGDGVHYICIYPHAVEYRNADNATHRDDGKPAYIDWSTGGGTMHFCQNGFDHRTDGPAILYPARDDDFYVVSGKDCGEASDPVALKHFEREYKSATGNHVDQQKLLQLRMGRYIGYQELADEIKRAKDLWTEFAPDTQVASSGG